MFPALTVLWSGLQSGAGLTRMDANGPVMAYRGHVLGGSKAKSVPELKESLNPMA
jgi:hypothetical protein